MMKTNTSSINVTISDLIGNSCYLFGVHGYIVNGYGLQTVIGNMTLSEPPIICKLVKLHSIVSSSALPCATIVSIISPQPTLGTTVKGMENTRINHYVLNVSTVTSCNTSTITILGVLVGILLIVVITCFIFNMLLLLYVRQYVEDIMFIVINFTFAD